MANNVWILKKTEAAEGAEGIDLDLQIGAIKDEVEELKCKFEELEEEVKGIKRKLEGEEEEEKKEEKKGARSEEEEEEGEEKKEEVKKGIGSLRKEIDELKKRISILTQGKRVEKRFINFEENEGKRELSEETKNIVKEITGKDNGTLEEAMSKVKEWGERVSGRQLELKNKLIDALINEKFGR